MQQLRILIAALLCAFMLLVAGCATQAVEDSGDDSDSDAMSEQSDATGDSSTSGVGDSGSVEGEGLTDGEIPPLEIRTIYFEFDESIVNEEGQVIIQAHAEVLVSNPSVTLNIAGHADERGTREYNLALGDQRGEAVSRYFQQFGVDASRINVVSYGEEQPVAMESNEEAWSLNRRAEFDY